MKREKEKEIKALERAERMAQHFDLLSPEIFVPFAVFYILIILACVLYDHIPVAVVLRLALEIGGFRIGLIPWHELCIPVELVTLWLAYGVVVEVSFSVRLSPNPLSPLIAIAASTFAGLLVQSTHLKEINHRETLRVSLGLLAFGLLVGLSGPYATSLSPTTWWPWRIAKASMFSFIWLLIQVESQGVNIVAGDTYTRSVERKWIHAGWLLWSHWLIAIVGTIVEGAFLITLIRRRRIQRKKKEDGDLGKVERETGEFRDISLIAKATRNEESGGAPRMASYRQHADTFSQNSDNWGKREFRERENGKGLGNGGNMQKDDIEEGGSWDAEDLYVDSEVVDYSSDEDFLHDSNTKPAPPPSFPEKVSETFLSGEREPSSSSDWDTFSNPDIIGSSTMTTLHPGAEIPAGAVPIPLNSLSPQFPHSSIPPHPFPPIHQSQFPFPQNSPNPPTFPQSPKGGGIGEKKHPVETSAATGSGYTDPPPFATNWSRRPKSRLGTQTRRGAGF